MAILYLQRFRRTYNHTPKYLERASKMCDYLRKLKWLSSKAFGAQWYISHFYFLLKYNRLKWQSYIYNVLGAHTITRLNTWKEPARCAIIIRLCFSYVKSCCLNINCSCIIIVLSCEKLVVLYWIWAWSYP